MHTDFPELPEFLKRQADAAPRSYPAREHARKIKHPTGKKQGRWLPRSMDAQSWALLRAQEREAREKVKARLTALKALKKKQAPTPKGRRRQRAS